MKALVFGEVLWDVFAEDKKPGGAPMNFCAHISRLGAEGYMLTSVGKDELGDAILCIMDSYGMPKDYVKVNDAKPTGTCNVTLDEQGQPSYDLVMDTAYDNITVSNEDLQAIDSHKFDVLYFGSLALRNKVSFEALNSVINNCSFSEIFCDINIRQNYYSKALIEDCFNKSTIIKINRDELQLVKDMKLVNSDCMSIEDVCRSLCRKYDLKVVTVTLDSDGAVAYSRSEDRLYTAQLQKATLVSAVGAGDSFSACFMYNYMCGVDIPSCIERANILGAYVVGFEEAIPAYSDEIIKKVKE